MLWFSAPTRLNQTLEDEETKIARYHEVVDMAIAEAISVPVGGSHTRPTCMLTTVAAILHRKQHRNWDEQGNEGLEKGTETCALALCR